MTEMLSYRAAFNYRSTGRVYALVFYSPFNQTPMYKTPFDLKPEIEPVQPVTMTEQTRILIDHLRSGNTINFVQARDKGITHLAQRIAELRAHDIQTYQRQIRMYHSPCMEYSLYPFPDHQPELENLSNIKPSAARRQAK